MAFWDSLSKKASETTAKAIQQAKILSETARLNSLIADEESKISNNYYQIGKLYAALHQADFDEDFAGMIAAIAESEQKIKDYRIQIQNVKGVLRCEKCGAEVAKGVAFCSSCGTAMPKAEADGSSERDKCEHCGSLVEKGMRFCTSCGSPMTAMIPAAVAPADMPEEDSAKRSCANCGAELADNVAFCTECGTKI